MVSAARRRWRRAARIALASLIAIAAATVTSSSSAAAQQRSGADLYRAACAACHGGNGRVASPPLLGFDTPLPDFTDCRFASREAQADWHAVVHRGGPVRGFDPMMPAFGDALSDDEIARVLGHVKSFCASRAWPPGELNLPRPLVTEKAYPEDEVVVSSSLETGGASTAATTAIYERRIGARQQVEIAIPFLAAHDASASARRSRGIGDISVATKRALAHSLNRGSILSAGAELVLPTGDRASGLGAGTTIVEPFVAFGQILRTDGFLHVQAGAELPADTTRAGRELFWRGAIGRTFTENRFGRAWSPMVELLGARELTSGERTHWDLVPQVQVSLSRRQHILASIGVRMPLNDTTDRHPQVLGYLLWDWFDGGFFQGW